MKKTILIITALTLLLSGCSYSPLLLESNDKEYTQKAPTTRLCIFHLQYYSDSQTSKDVLEELQKREANGEKISCKTW